jgi:iron complex transport system substrate-binding protein
VNASSSATARRRSLHVAVLAALVMAVSACAAAPGAVSPSPAGAPQPSPAATPAATPAITPASAFPLTLTDDEGTEVTIPAEPQRIVSLTPATTEILFAIGAGDRVIATTDFDDYPPEAVDLPDVASYVSVDVEKIVGLDADLVIAGGNFFNDPEAIRRIRELGIPVVVVYAQDVAGVLHDIELTGTAVGRADEARDLAASMRAAIDQVAAATRDRARPAVFYEIDATHKIYTAADGSFLEEMIVLAGGNPITTGSTTSYEISLEVLVTADPEVIVLGDAAYGVTPEDVAARPGWSGISAVRNGSVRPVNDLIVTRPGPRLVEGLRELALAIHPDIVLPPPTATPAS